MGQIVGGEKHGLCENFTQNNQVYRFLYLEYLSFFTPAYSRQLISTDNIWCLRFKHADLSSFPFFSLVSHNSTLANSASSGPFCTTSRIPVRASPGIRPDFAAPREPCAPTTHRHQAHPLSYSHHTRTHPCPCYSCTRHPCPLEPRHAAASSLTPPGTHPRASCAHAFAVTSRYPHAQPQDAAPLARRIE